MKKSIINILLILSLIIIFNFLEYDLAWNTLEQFIYPIVLALITLISFTKAKFRKIILFLSLIILGVMIFVYLMDEIVLANSVGGIGFALLCIALISYLPVFFEKGYIENL